MTDELIGRQFGGYAIQAVIGVGGMATVYRAQQLSINRTVAIKILPRQYLKDDTYMQRFEREVRIAAQLEHRSIVPVHDYGQVEGQPYIVMRYMAGGSVDDLLEASPGKPLALERVVRIVEQIASALDFAHSKGVLHRDLKPSNVLLDEGGDCYLTDFGIARIIGEAASPITTQGVVGTPSYMSPEQAQGWQLDGRSDVYSLGVMLFEMATGRRPFESDTPYGVAVKQVTEAPPMPRSLNPELSIAIEQVILVSLSKRREDRYANAVSLAEALKRAVQGGSPGFKRVPDTEPSIRRGALPAVEQTSYAPAPTAAPASQPDYPTPAEYAPIPSAIASTPVPRQPIRVARRQNGRLILSAGLGVVIGCGLLTLLTAVVLLIVINADRIEREAGTLEADRRNLTFEATARSVSTLSVQSRVTPDASPTPLPGAARPQTATAASARARTRSALTSADRPTAAVFGAPLLIYAAESGGGFDLFARRLDTGETIALITHPADDLAPVVSPDGTRVAFLSDRGGGFDLYLLTLADGAVRAVLDAPGAIRAPSWTPDGRRLLFALDTRGDGSAAIMIIDADGGDLRRLYGDDGRSSDPVMSADGRYVLFTNGQPNDATTWEILRLDAETGSVTPLTRNRVKDWAPLFTPDGAIIYATDGDGYGSLAIMDGDGGSRRTLYDSPGYDWGARLNPDGSALWFTSDVSGIDEVYNVVFQLPLIDVQPEQITDGGGLWGSATS